MGVAGTHWGDRPMPDRFWMKVDRSGGGCWLWTAAVNKNGYGSFWFEDKVESAHRVAWVLTYGPIPDGLHVLHHCDVPLCCNPVCLFLGTNQDNAIDREAKGRGRWARVG